MKDSIHALADHKLGKWFVSQPLCDTLAVADVPACKHGRRIPEHPGLELQPLRILYAVDLAGDPAILDARRAKLSSRAKYRAHLGGVALLSGVVVTRREAHHVWSRLRRVALRER